MSAYDDIADAYNTGKTDGAAKECKRIVALLRKWAAEMLEDEPTIDDKIGAEAMRNAADALEAWPDAA